MKILEIIEMPTELAGNGDRVNHESLVRSYWILEKVLEWARLGTPAPVLVELIELLKGPKP